MNKNLIAKAGLLAGLSLLAATTQSATAGVITFDGQPLGAMGFDASFQEAGFTIVATTNPSNHPSDQATIYDLGGGNHAVGDGDVNDFFGTLLDITLTGGGLFDVTSIDFANLGSGGSPGTSGCGGDRIDISDLTNCFSVHPAGGTGFTTQAVNFLGISHLQLNFVSFSGANFVADNIVASPSAPEPSTFLLGIGAFAGFAARRHFRRA